MHNARHTKKIPGTKPEDTHETNAATFATGDFSASTRNNIKPLPPAELSIRSHGGRAGDQLLTIRDLVAVLADVLVVVQFANIVRVDLLALAVSVSSMVTVIAHQRAACKCTHTLTSFTYITPRTTSSGTKF